MSGNKEIAENEKFADMVWTYRLDIQYTNTYM